MTGRAGPYGLRNNAEIFFIGRNSIPPNLSSTSITASRHAGIPTGFRLKAQGLPRRGYPGSSFESPANRNAVAAFLMRRDASKIRQNPVGLFHQ